MRGGLDLDATDKALIDENPLLGQVFAHDPQVALQLLKRIKQAHSSNGTTLNPSESALAKVDLALGKLIEGYAAFNAPDRATIRKSQVIEARFSPSKSPSDLILELQGQGKKESASLRVGEKMSATLNGAGAFDVSPSAPQVQLISSKDTTIWAWTITPKTAGTQFLVLSFDAFITVDGKEGTRTISTLIRKIDVLVSWPETLDEWLDYGKKLFEGLNWVWATFLVPLAAYVIHLWRKWTRLEEPKAIRHKAGPASGRRAGRSQALDGVIVSFRRNCTLRPQIASNLVIIVQL